MPVSGHAPDAATMDATLSMIEEFDPNLVFVNLGDIDRMGHADETGPVDVRAMRQAALADTDRQVSRLVDLLKSSGRWKNSIVIVLADHSMDWSNPDQVISLTGPLEDDPFLAGKVADRAERRRRPPLLDRARRRPGPRDRPDARRRRRRPRRPHGPRPPRTRRCGSARRPARSSSTARPGGGSPSPTRPATRSPATTATPPPAPIPFFIGGGHPAVPRAGRRRPNGARTVDVAPTVAAFFGVGRPAGGYDGHNLL